MTFVASRRFGQRIIMVSDTAISNPGGILRSTGMGGHAHDYVPGRLKAFPLSMKTSVGYAGASNKALSAIRRVRSNVDVSADLSGTLGILAKASEDGSVDFLVVSHVNGPQSFKVRNGIISNDQPEHWIGDAAITTQLDDAIAKARVRRQQAIRDDEVPVPEEFGSDEEHLFTAAWMDLLLTAPTLSPSVGGIPVILLGSPYGHCFNTGAGSYNPSRIHVSANGRITNDDGIVVNSLHGQYSYSAVQGRWRGAPVLGIWLQESQTALLYDPISTDDTRRYSPSSISQLRQMVDVRASALGGTEVE